MSYNDDKASEYDKAANQSSQGSTEYWDNVVKKGNHQVQSQLDQEAQQGYGHVWSPGSGSAPNGYPLGGGSYKSGSGSGPLWRMMKIRLFWACVWVALCAGGYWHFEGQIRNAANLQGWTQGRPAGRITEIDTLQRNKNIGGANETIARIIIERYGLLFKDPAQAERAIVQCASIAACVKHPLGVWGYLKPMAIDQEGYWQYLCNNSYNMPLSGMDWAKPQWGVVADKSTYKWGATCEAQNVAELKKAAFVEDRRQRSVLKWVFGALAAFSVLILIVGRKKSPKVLQAKP